MCQAPLTPEDRARFTVLHPAVVGEGLAFEHPVVDDEFVGAIQHEMIQQVMRLTIQIVTEELRRHFPDIPAADPVVPVVDAAVPADDPVAPASGQNIHSRVPHFATLFPERYDNDTVQL